jgi:hypothetical protein
LRGVEIQVAAPAIWQRFPQYFERSMGRNEFGGGFTFGMAQWRSQPFSRLTEIPVTAFERKLKIPLTPTLQKTYRNFSRSKIAPSVPAALVPLLIFIPERSSLL